MTRRQLLAALGARAATLGGLRQRLEAFAGPNLRWAVSMFLWTSTQWPDRAPVPFTDMLEVIKDTGFDGLARLAILVGVDITNRHGGARDGRATGVVDTGNPSH